MFVNIVQIRYLSCVEIDAKVQNNSNYTKQNYEYLN